MADPWEAEVHVDAPLVARVVARQFPALANHGVVPFGTGWDNAAFLVGGEYVFRFPRRAIAVALIETEVRALPSIAARVPLPVPVPVFAGKPDRDYPWPFAGHALLHGDTLSSVKLGVAAYERLAEACGAFLRALHAVDATSLPAPGLQPDAIGRLDHAQRMPKVTQRLHELQHAGLVDDAAAFEALLERLAPSPARSRRLAVVHGDLYARHIVVDAEGRAAGIIDWGDVHFGDPAVDLAIAYEVFPPRARAAFAAAYGDADDETWNLARYRAVYHSALVAHYGHRIGDAELIDAGLAGLSACRV